MAGNPGKAAKRQEFLDAFKAHHGVIAKACADVGISTRTVLRWRERYATFAAAFDEVREQAIGEWETALNAAGLEQHHPQTIQWTLARMAPDRWSERRTLELAGLNGGPVQVEVKHGMSEDMAAAMKDPEARELLKRLNRRIAEIRGDTDGD